jgi:antitoxin component YwqK of YwqJK toxin-antitoxin module
MITNKTYKNGQKITSQKGDAFTYFFKSGIIRAQGKMVGGVMEGKWIFNRGTGELWQIGHFKANQKHGRWVRYDRKGKPEYDEEFENSKLKKRK